MRFRIRIGFVWIMLAGLQGFGACQHAAGPDEAAQTERMSGADNDAVFGGISNETGIAHLLIASVEMQSLAYTEDPSAVSDVLAFLTETEAGALASRRIVRVEDASVATAIATIMGVSVSDPTIMAEGLLVTTYTEATWGRIKCCYKDPKCCPKKKKEQ